MVTCLDRVVMCWRLQPDPHVWNPKRTFPAKINPAFGAGHVTRKPIYFTLSKATSSFRILLSLTLQSQIFTTHSFRHAAKNEKTYSQQNYIHSPNKISIFTILQYTKFPMDINTHISNNTHCHFNIIHTHTHEYLTNILAHCYFVSTFPSLLCL